MEKAFSPFLWQSTQWRAGLSTPGCCSDSLNTMTRANWEIQFICILGRSRAHFKSPEKMILVQIFSWNLYHAFPTRCHEKWPLSHYSNFCANTTKINYKSVFSTVGQSVRSNEVTQSAYSAGRQRCSVPLTMENFSTWTADPNNAKSNSG